MTLTLELEPELEQRLQQRSAAFGLSADQFALRLLNDLLRSEVVDDESAPPPLSDEEWRAKFNAFPMTMPNVLSDEAISREGLYE